MRRGGRPVGDWVGCAVDHRVRRDRPSELDPGYAQLVPDLTAFLRSSNARTASSCISTTARAVGPWTCSSYTFPAKLRSPCRVLTRSWASRAIWRRRREPSHISRHLRGASSAVGTISAEEHWTCQAMDDLWDRAPNAGALDFCLRWQAFNRKLQYRAGDTPYDADGAYGFGPLFAPRLTPVGSRSEAAHCDARRGRAEGPACATSLRRSTIRFGGRWRCCSGSSSGRARPPFGRRRRRGRRHARQRGRLAASHRLRPARRQRDAQVAEEIDGGSAPKPPRAPRVADATLPSAGAELRVTCCARCGEISCRSQTNTCALHSIG